MRPPLALLCGPRLVHVGSLVSDDERARANGLVDDDAVAFLASRALGRLAVGAYCGSPAAEVVVARRCHACGDGTHGRPYVVGKPVGLSTSRRRHLVAAAVADIPIAIDLEPLTNSLGVPDGSLTGRELAAAVIPVHRLVLWTRKECLVKLGLCALDDFGQIEAGSPTRPDVVIDGVRLTTLVLQEGVVTIATPGGPSPEVAVVCPTISGASLADPRAWREGQRQRQEPVHGDRVQPLQLGGAAGEP